MAAAVLCFVLLAFSITRRIRATLFLKRADMWRLRRICFYKKSREARAAFLISVSRKIFISNAAKTPEEKSPASHLCLATAIISNAAKAKRKKSRASLPSSLFPITKKPSPQTPPKAKQEKSPANC